MRDEGLMVWLVTLVKHYEYALKNKLGVTGVDLHDKQTFSTKTIGRREMRKQLRFRWTAGVTTTAGHVATSLIPTDTFTRDFINKAIGISAGVYGFDPSYLDRKEFVNRPIVIKGGLVK
jgi:hypothetical protein